MVSVVEPGELVSTVGTGAWIPRSCAFFYQSSGISTQPVLNNEIRYLIFLNLVYLSM